MGQAWGGKTGNCRPPGQAQKNGKEIRLSIPTLTGRQVKTILKVEKTEGPREKDMGPRIQALALDLTGDFRRGSLKHLRVKKRLEPGPARLTWLLFSGSSGKKNGY